MTTTKSGGGCVVLWICLALVTIPFYVFRAQSYIFHGKLGCSSVFHEANALIDYELNSTRRVLRSPNYYMNISQTCLEADKCSHVIKNSAEHSGLNLSSLCPFFVFYNGNFSSCGDRLLGRVGQNITCIDVLFGTGLELNDTYCQQWESIHNCLLDSIQSTCYDVWTNFISTKISEQFRILEKGFCTNPGNSTMETNEDEALDTEILEFSEA